MSYIEELNLWLDELVETFLDKVIVDKDDSRGETLDDFKNEIRSKVVESYRNGQKSKAFKDGGWRQKSRSN